ncbi:meiotically up-regulated 65 protein [Blastomyces dermatitidis ER-3]|uniref:Meiotically up-regulated 65 protein n=2 Tax=Ajellomyces dermatitidis TaxID=5039 RepID=F2TBD8_AJEDA|nr:meiotically up-regulated 65 protein [Blastomyces dermatitidis ER-3]EEQ87941.1 meiotically up-regulated 65 protein [Blastomyces dermatitidis ER-3]EGE80525.1 meiotically up-regulated 65 protein [Blastomyces dermatitidis ATCC 18188]EQL33068.1 hypothetical protein BDFG_04815 [Blastomyces dermatitidis ATCC 26199]
MSTVPGISLIDNTSTTTSVERTPSRNVGLEQSPSTGSRTATALTKKLRKGSMKDSLARRKYAKYQQNRYNTGDGTDSIDGDSEARHSREPSLSQRGSADMGMEHWRSGNTTKLGKQIATDVSSEVAAVSSQARQHPGASEKSAIDVLYENQRGWWFFGIPLYSAKSLLNLDPSAWLTRNFEVSPVNITNAQVPDPSWEWAWDTWYIDMSYDVDEAGWQYSFSFSSRFAWHGTHPWYHCFVRRRRWLRKRVKKTYIGPEEDIAVGKACAPNWGSFAVSSSRAPSAEPESRRGRRRAVSTVSARAEDIVPEDITNIGTLLSAMRWAALDRDKILAVQHFVKYADEELCLLPEKMPEVLSTLVYHTSRRQLLDYIRHTIETIPADSEGVQKRRRDSLVKIIEDGRLTDLEFWKDEKVLTREKGNGSGDRGGSERADQLSSRRSKGKAVVRNIADME